MITIETLGTIFPVGLIVVNCVGAVVWKLKKWSREQLIPTFIIVSLIWVFAIMILIGLMSPSSGPSVVRYIYANSTAVLNNGTIIRFQVIP